MVGMRWLVLAMVIAAGPALAQSDEDYAKHAQPVIDEFVACEKPKLGDMARGTDSADAIVERAIKECQKHLDNLAAVMRAEPFNLNEGEADEAIKIMLDQMRPVMLETVKEARGA